VFGWFKKRTLSSMNNLVRTAQMTVAMALMRQYGFDKAKSEAEKNETAAKGSAAANFLNGQSPSPMHAQLDLPQIHAEARQWLRNNAVMRELVVQTLRVSSVVDHETGRRDPLREEVVSVLTEFGEEFPVSPSTKSYQALVLRAIGTLAPENQQRLMRFMETGR
jgi:hypothetical protein